MNIFVTKKCGNNCPYCFAKDFMNDRTELSRKNAIKFINFLKRNKKETRKPLPTLNIMGGEPLLYQDLGWFIKEIQSNKDQLVSNFTIFTGGIFPTENLNLLDGIRGIEICLNLNEKRIYSSEGAYNLVIKNLKTMIDQKGLQVGIGYNIASMDFCGDEIIGTVKRFGIDHLRIAIANPVYNSKEIHVVTPDKYHELSPKVFKFIKKCHANGIEVNLDCRIPFCFFTERQIGWFVTHNQRHIIDGIQSCACGGGALCISPELEVSKCTVFHKFNENLEMFSSIPDINGWVLNCIDAKFGIPELYPKCATCPHRTRCSGGCPAWKKDFLNNPDEVTQVNELLSLLKKNIGLYNQYLETNDPTLHDEFLQNEQIINNKSKNLPRKPDLEMYYTLYLYYKSTNNSKKARHFKRKSIHYGLQTRANFNKS